MADEGLQAPNLTWRGDDVPAVAAGADKDTIICKAPFDGVIKSVNYTPGATLTGANTDSRTLSLINKGQSGAGTVVPAVQAFTSGVNAPANDDKAIPLSATTADLNVTKGDVLVWHSLHVGSTGLADPGGYVEVGFDRS